jgi:hypothetical protein
MKPMAVLHSLALAVLGAAGAMAVPPNDQPEAVTIRLDQIWAYNIPGTRDIEDLNPPSKLAFEIRVAIGFPPKKKDANHGFAVQGEGFDALREAHAVFVEEKTRRDTFSANSEISAVFFAHETRRYVHLHKVERQGNNINIYYRFIPHETEETTRHFALIPLGRLPIGNYRVKVIQSPMEQKYADIGFRPLNDDVARRIVCRPFSFSVSQQGE